MGVSFINYKGSEDTNLIKTGEEDDLKDFYIPSEDRIIGFAGLDEVYYSLKQSSLTRPIDLIGAKYLEGNRVYIIGGPLSQLLSFSLKYLIGLKYKNEAYKVRDAAIRSAFEYVFSNQPHYTSLSLPAFETSNAV